MAGSVNKVLLVGRVGKDPESRTTQGGGKVVNLSVATSENWTDRGSGERKERTEWHRVVIFNEKTGDAVMQYVKKGSMVWVEGTLQTRKWTDQAGQEKYSTEVVISAFRGEVVFLTPKGGDDSQSGSRGTERSGAGNQRAAGGSWDQGKRGGNSSWTPPSGGDLDDEIPF